ncbi:MAG: hypothetical protein M3Y64_05720 [Gemmatimonadota bacterium]|nr:hypothetical protein [Gemmatimonadota bacterium]
MDNIRNTDNDMKANMTPGTTSSGMLTGTFRDPASADAAYSDLVKRGYSDKDINVMMSNETRDKYFKHGHSEIGNKAAEGGATGAAIGGVTGVIVGLLAAAGTLAIPGAGIVLAGPLVAALTGLGAGGAAGGLIGAMVGAGMTEERARLYEKDIKDGGIVIGTKARSAADAEALQTEWKKNRAENVYY